LVKSSGTERVSHHLGTDLGREDSTINVARALVGAEHVLALGENGVELVDHTTLKLASFVELIEKKGLLDEDADAERGANEEASQSQVAEAER